MRVWIFYPPLKTMSGGCMVLLQIARQLLAMGRLGGVLYWEAAPEGPDFVDLPWMRAGQAHMIPADVFLVPEGWPNALVFGFRARCRTVVYCQNWAYLFHGLDAGVRWRDLPVEFVAVSDPVAWHLEQVLGRRPGIIRPIIDTAVFHPGASKPEGPVRVGFMPRKNKALADQVRRIFEERNPDAAVEWMPIHGLDRRGVAEALRFCHVFLATGFPEGFALPPLEAMACGCLCAGFTGFGGWDYMRQVAGVSFAPQGYALRDVPWGGNGWWAADGDVLGAALGLERALATILFDDAALSVTQNGDVSVAAYNTSAQAAEILTVLGTQRTLRADRP
ncbi:glycosyltransferase [Desulfomicrobium escambiense]|uniref:glycosyltransferase n=1 Tax=Desulfomicrobium escambiense TaxID=29503 RepID=UPI00041539AE|nr:glycosyltransferase [Desulfomicrobium escambiense]